MHVCNFHKLALQASMVFHNIVELCIIQIRPELWPRTVLRKITDPLPFLAHGAHGSSLSAWNHKEETEHFTQNIIVKQWHKASFQETSPAWSGQNRQRPGLGLRNSGLDLQITFQRSSEKQLGRSVYENST